MLTNYCWTTERGDEAKHSFIKKKRTRKGQWITPGEGGCIIWPEEEKVQGGQGKCHLKERAELKF